MCVQRFLNNTEVKFIAGPYELSLSLFLFATPSNIFINPMLRSGRESIFTPARGEEGVREALRAPCNFLGGIHWPFLRKST